MSDYKQLDVLINDAGQLPTAINSAIVAALANGVPFDAIYPVLSPLAKLSKALQAIQAWSTAAQKPAATLYQDKPVTHNADGTLSWNGQKYASEMDIAGGRPIAAHVAEKLPSLVGDLFTQMVAVARTGHHNQALQDALGANYNAYAAAYGPGGYYWKDVLDAPK
jgi:hypothetical protein